MTTANGFIIAAHKRSAIEPTDHLLTTMSKLEFEKF